MLTQLHKRVLGFDTVIESIGYRSNTGLWSEYIEEVTKVRLHFISPFDKYRPYILALHVNFVDEVTRCLCLTQV